MRDLPTGTVTFLFTDVEGSTRLLNELGAEAYGEALAEHRRLLRVAFARQGGVEVDTQGDAFFYVFATAPGAVKAAEEGQESLAGGRISVRMGVHTGTPRVTDEGYVGPDVHRAARIASAGHGGQVLVSAATAALVPDATLRDLGEHRLKDLSAAERIYQLGAADFPPLKTLYQTNLPTPATPFLGRAIELAALEALLARADVRLLTLTGPGGTGKTRLALQAAALAAESYPDGVWWVPLAPLRDPELVLSSTARALGATGPLRDHIDDRRLLILFDNFEHVLDAAPDLSELLQACPHLDVLVTSREPLHLVAEQEYAVPPFRPGEAVAFFTARARAVRQEFEANGVVAEVCRRLDDLPLALELAAARVKVLSPQQILERLEERLPLLTGGARDLPQRQRTLKATIDWSYHLLTDEEQRVFSRLAVFAGGCTLVAAEQVAGADLDTLASLVDKSLLRFSAGRYWMLESIREYAAGRLAESGEADALRRRHAHHFADLVGSAGLSLEPEGEQRYGLVRQELDNVRTAIDWGRDADPELALRMTAALEGFWAMTDPSEGMRRLEALLAKVPDASPEVRASAFRAYGSSANPAGDDELAERCYEKSLEAYREVGDERGVAAMLFRLANSALYRGDTERADKLAAESLALSREIGYRAVEAQALAVAGEVEYAQGNREAGAELIEQSARLAGEVNFPWWRARMLRKLVDCLLELERPRDAELAGRESLRLMNEIGDRQMLVFTLARLARIAAETGRDEQAGLLWGAIEAEEERRPMGAWSKERGRLGAPVLARAAARDFGQGREKGRRLELEEAVEVALEGSRA
ncbi:MAG: tetratricopeptide repeat protein [Actinomycetota bacterium]|nr:tetratricopeptide repeat protein [Actinomycetota bacterium]